MLNDIPVQRRFSLSNALARRSRHAFRVRNSNLVSRRKTLTRFIESKAFSIGILIPTAYMLFIHDVINASGAPASPALSATIGSLDLIVFIIFLAEIGCNIWAYRMKYVASGLFVLDAISLVSLIPAIIENIFGIPLDAALTELAIARVARIARVASRLARLPKFVELLSCTDRRRHEQAVNIEPSAIAKRLEFRISTKIVLAMVILLIVTWLCTQSLDVEPHAQVALHEFETVAMSTNFQGPIYQSVYDIYTTEYKLLRLQVGERYLINEESTIKRTQSYYKLPISTNTSNAIILVQGEQEVISALAITQTICTIIILCVACALISRDTLVLVVHPIERMLSLIKKLTLAISAYTDSNMTSSPSFDTDEEEGSDGSIDDVENKGKRNSAGDSESTDSLGIKEADMLVEFVDMLAQSHMEMDSQRKIEHQRRKALSGLAAGVSGWYARRRYHLIVEMFRKREHVANEIFSTEKTYVNSLQVLSNVFMTPLKDSGVVGDDAINSIFLGLDAILVYNTNLLEKIHQQFEPSWSIHSRLGHIFEHMEDMVDVYSKFINNCTNSAALLTKYRESHPKFSHFIEEQERHPACNHLNISSFLIMPVQRAPRYHLLLEQLLKYTPTNHLDYVPTLAAIDTIKRVNNLMNERKRETENRTTIHNIYMRLEPNVDALMDPHCVYIREGPLLHEGESFLFFLFNSVLLQCHTKEGGVRLVVVNEIPVNSIGIVTPIADSPHFGLKHAFQFESNMFKLLLCAPNQLSQGEWVEAIHQCIHKSSEKEQLHSARTKSRKERVGTLNLEALKAGTPRRKLANTIVFRNDTKHGSMHVSMESSNSNPTPRSPHI